jgi:hypothetical protein
MRKQIIAITAALLLTAPLRAEGELHRYGLVQLPHPVGKLAAEPERFQLTPEQQEGVEAIVAEVPAKMHAMLSEAKAAEEKIRRAVLDGGNNPDSLDRSLEELAELKRRISALHIDALERLRGVLTPDQFREVTQQEQITFGTLKN